MIAKQNIALLLLQALRAGSMQVAPGGIAPSRGNVIRA
jgi:hypothetical protein